MSAKSPVSPTVVVAIIAALVLLVGFLGWRTLGGASGGDRVHVDANTVRAQLQQNGGFGHR